ncbi:Serine phosphatase RsbU, regulator of sigma subunit [hydrothermal vent metagenome]|uniref:Serine phosphatase RsbU, regulator of sigma subunit n=1 Tax=hydrothermal vent metagenome TaxID=652676 RepID=A0A3B1BIB0_9ZZZZ
MKIKIVSAFLLIINGILFSQQSDTLIVSHDVIDSTSIEVYDGWKYHSGDDSSWADRNFDDFNWKSVDARMIISDSTDFDWKGIGWFRRIIRIDSALVNSNIALSMYHYGASQIFLNGKLVHEFGKVSEFPDSEQIYQPRNKPIVINLDTNSVYLLAVRYSNWSAKVDKDWYNRWFSQIGFTLKIAGTNNFIRSTIINEELTFSVNIGISGIFLTLSLLYLLLYLFYQRNRENLYYSLFTFFLGVLFFISIAIRLNTSSLNLEVIFMMINSFALPFVFVSYLGFLYSIFYTKLPKQFFFFLFVAVVILIFVATNLPSDFENYTVIGLLSLSSIEGLRVITLAIKRKQENSWIIGAGVVIYAVFIIGLIVISLTTLEINSIYGLVFFFVGLLGLPLSMSVYLARNIAVTNRNLEEQLITVKELSQREIENQKRTAELEIKAERERIENERKTKELEEARKLQLSLLPKELPKLPEYDIAVHMKTATEVGGDYYDFHVSEDGTLTTVIGDATGHGLMAGTMVTATKSLFNYFAAEMDILATLSKMADSLRGMNFRLLSMCFAIVKINDMKLRVSSAGMPPVLIHRKKTDAVEEIFLRGMPLGSSATYEYELKEVELDVGDLIFMYSDGFPELFNQKKEMFGYDRVKQEIQRVAHNDSQEIINELNKVISNWAGDRAPDDDITFVVIKVRQ